VSSKRTCVTTRVSRSCKKAKIETLHGETLGETNEGREKSPRKEAD